MTSDHGKVRKAVIPAAGRGTRFLPATKAQPKEMLPIIDKPTIQYVVEEAVAAGLNDILIITSREKRAVEDHFDRDGMLENMLHPDGPAWQDYLPLRQLSEQANLHYIRQKESRGLGDAIYHARQHVGEEPFAVLLGDSIVTADRPCIAQLIDVYERHQAPVIGLEEVPAEVVDRYGIVGGTLIEDRVYEVTTMVEKPSPQEAPSRLAIGARYILTPDIFDHIARTRPGKGGEIQLTDAMERLRATRRVLGYHFVGRRHDIGNKLDFLKTTVQFAAQRDDLGQPFMAFLRQFVSDLDGPESTAR